VLGQESSARKHRDIFDQAIVTIDNNNVREILIEQLMSAHTEIATVIHPKPFVSPLAQVVVGATSIAGVLSWRRIQHRNKCDRQVWRHVDHQARVVDYGHVD